ncbi:MAG: AraC family transcriptional regulator [Sedimentisphaeraceae bacterium JB056]
MIIWTVGFNIIRPLSSFPTPLRVEREVQDNPSYVRVGKNCNVENRCTMTYTISGKGQFQDSSGQYTINPGDVFLRIDNDPSMFFSYPKDGKEKWDFIWFNYCGESAAQYTKDIISRNGPLYQLDSQSPIIQKLSSYQSYSGMSCNITPGEGSMLVIEALAALNQSHNEDFNSSSQNRLILKAQKFISNNISHNISVAEIAAAISISREHLSRIFAENLHITPYEYLVKQKMTFACQMLNNSTLSNKEISSRLGYNDQAQFSRIFKKTLNMTPTEFRKAGINHLL